MTAEIPEVEPQSGPELFPVAIGEYQRPELPDLQVGAEVGRVLELLADFEPVYHRWPGRSDQRDATAVQQRLLTWAQPDQPGNSLLYWVGHGWSDDKTAALAHSASPPEIRTFGVNPGQLADAVISRQLTADGAWAIVVVDACQSNHFIRQVASIVYDAASPVERVLLVGVSADGATALGRFSRALECLLRGTYQDRTSITLNEIGKDLGSQLPGARVVPIDLGDAALVRAAPPPASLSGPLDSIRYLEDALAGLSADERRHFLSKAQSAEDGEISWFFEGRQDECAEVVAWIAGHDHGIMAVTGSAGTGKSALLGNLLIHSLPDVRSALLRRGLIDPLPPRSTPGDHAFDYALHLSGLTIHETISKIAEGAGCGPLPSADDPLLGLANDIDWLYEELRHRGTQYTLLADALDEAVDPLDTARVLARLAADTSLRIILGTRPSVAETPDHPVSDDSLLRALALGGTPTTVRWLGQDSAAVRRYVYRRLREARDHPGRRRTPISDHPPLDESIAAAATAIAERDERFLFARLAVHELIYNPSLLEKGRSYTLRQLLAGTHRDLFASAVARLGREHDAFVPLIQALALAKGRGLPVEDDVWGTAAAALLPGAAGDGTDQPVDRSVIQDLIDNAPAYIAVASEADQTVYRLAHRTFAEYFMPPSVAEQIYQQQCQAVAAALLRTAADQAPLITSNYLRRYLSAHIADAGLWDELDGQLPVLDGLDPNAMTADIAASLFGDRPVPAQLAGVLSARPRLVDADPADRAGLRQLAVLTHDPARHVLEPAPDWGVAAAALQAKQVHLVIPAHDGGANAVCPMRAQGGRELLVSAGFDGTARLWDPFTAAPIGEPMAGHDGAIEDVCVLTAGAGGSQLATAGDDATIRLWDPATAQPVGRPMTGHDGSIWELCAIPDGRSGQLLVSAGNDRTLRVWDPRTCTQVGPPLTGHDGGILGLCPLWMDGAATPWIVSAGEDGSVRLWDPLRGRQIGRPMIANGSQVWMVQAVRTRNQRVLVAAVGIDGVVRLWDPSRQELVGSPLFGHGGPVWRGCAVPDPSGGDRLATAGGEGDIWLWDLAPDGPVGRPMRGHVGTVWGICGLTGQRPGTHLLASAGGDGTIRIWDTSPAAPVPESAASGTTPVTAVAYLPDAGPRPVIAASRTDGSVRRWDPVTGVPAGAPLTGHDGPVWSACSVRLPDERVLIVTAGNDGTVRRWDPETAEQVGPPLTDHAGAVWSICRVPLSEGQERVLTTSADGTIRLWNLADPQPVGTPLVEDLGNIYVSCATTTRADAVAVFSASARGDLLRWEPGSGAAMAVVSSNRHPGSIIGLCTLPDLDGALRVATATDDGTVRMWDPVTGSQVGPSMIDQSGCMWNLCFLPGSRGSGRLATISDDGAVRQWDPGTGQSAGPVLSGHVGQGWGICALPSGLLPGEVTHLASGGQDGAVCVWDPFSARLRGAPLDDSHQSVGVVRLTANGAAGLTCLLVSRDGVLSTWHPGQRWWRPAWRAGHVTTVCLPDPGNSVAMIGCTDGSLHTVDLHSTAPVQPPAPASAGAAILALAPVPGGTVAWVGYGDGTVRPRNVRAACWDGPPMRVQDGPVQSLCVVRTAQASLLACGGQDGQITLVDLADAFKRDELATESDNWIWSMCSLPMPGGAPDLLVSASSDHLVRLWDPATRRPAGEPLAGHAGQVRAVAAVSRQDGATLLASGGADGNVCLWHPVSRQLVRTIPIGLPICDLAGGIGDLATQRRTDGGAIIVAGTTQGIIAIDLNAKLFTAA